LAHFHININTLEIKSYIESLDIMFNIKLVLINDLNKLYKMIDLLK